MARARTYACGEENVPDPQEAGGETAGVTASRFFVAPAVFAAGGLDSQNTAAAGGELTSFLSHQRSRKLTGATRRAVPRFDSGKKRRFDSNRDSTCTRSG